MSNQAGLGTKNVQSGWVGDQECPVRLGWGPRMSSQAGLRTKNVQSLHWMIEHRQALIQSPNNS